MKTNIHYLFTPLILLISCGCNENVLERPVDSKEASYELVRIDTYRFRRAYHGHDTLSHLDLNAFMNRLPEQEQNYEHHPNHPYFDDLVESGIIQNGKLNVRNLDTLAQKFSYNISPMEALQVKTRLIEDPKIVNEPSIEISFSQNKKNVLIDTLGFGWPPDINIFKFDLNNDGKEELMSVFKWYIINGDNFTVNLYELEEL